MAKPKVYSLGDTQFQALNQWNYEAGNRFIDWFEDVEVEPGSYLIHLGDVGEKDINPGNVVCQMERFFNACREKFEKTFILVGNHDIKQYHGVTQVSFEFAEEKPGIEIVRDIKVLDLGGQAILAMPHVRVPGKTIIDYYNALSAEDYAKLLPPGKDMFDLCVGHWQKQTDDGGPTWLSSGVDISRIPAKRFALGHIHDRPFEEYTGSAWPLRVSEETGAFPRVIRVLGESDFEEDIQIPRILTYDKVRYPDPIQKADDGLIHVYTVDNCPNVGAARELYKGAHIRSLGLPPVDDGKSVTTEEDFEVKDFCEAFQLFLKEKGLRINRNVLKTVNEALKKAQ